MSDENKNVDHPKHYNIGKFEVIDVLEDWKLDFHTGNVVKYIARSKHKGNELEDLQKAEWYLRRKIFRLQVNTARKELNLPEIPEPLFSWVICKPDEELQEISKTITELKEKETNEVFKRHFNEVNKESPNLSYTLRHNKALGRTIFELYNNYKKIKELKGQINKLQEGVFYCEKCNKVLEKGEKHEHPLDILYILKSDVPLRNKIYCLKNRIIELMHDNELSLNFIDEKELYNEFTKWKADKEWQEKQ